MFVSLFRSTRALAALTMTATVLAGCTGDAPTAASNATIAADAAASMNDGGGAMHQSATVMWHAQQMHPLGTHNSGQVAGASAALVRRGNGVSYRLSSPSLLPGHAYTLWLVVVNNPAACAAFPCPAGDITKNPLTRSQVRWAAGIVAGASGHGTFAGAAQEGTLSGWLPDRSLEDAMHAEIHLVVNDHGPMIAAQMPGMIHTYRGGCSDTSPFPPPFPPSALADGEPGPNTCLLYQAAVFGAP